MIKVDLEITIERAKDILCTAFEGGSNYWIDRVVSPSRENQKLHAVEYFHECPVMGLSLKIFVIEGKSHILDFDSVTKGFDIMAAKYPKHFADFMAENDDAITADVFLQCCLFGDIIYG